MGQKPAFRIVDGIITHCLPPWFPSLETVLYLAGLGLHAACRATRATGVIAVRLSRRTA